ncbi:MAG: TolC family protein, partial [Gammaproteobacteria bacterium]
LLADAGLASENVSDLGDGDSVFTLLGVGVQWSGLGVFRVKNRVKRAKALAEQAHAEYKKVVLLAFEEVENALVNHRSTRAITQSLALSAEAARSAARLARERYEGGVIGFIEVLDAEKRLLDLESQLAAAKTQEALAVVALMRSVALQ